MSSRTIMGALTAPHADRTSGWRTPAVEHAGTKAFYSSVNDRIAMPQRNLLASAQAGGSTVLHEIGTVASVLVHEAFGIPGEPEVAIGRSNATTLSKGRSESASGSK